MAIGDGTGWDEASPANSDNVSDGPAEIRDLRIGAAKRLGREHVDPVAGSVGGRHIAGSAIAFYDDETDVSDRPDGGADSYEPAALSSTDDDGRLLVADGDGNAEAGQLFYWAGDQWNDLVITADNFHSTIDISGITLTLPTGQVLTEPEIADFSNSEHDHTDPTEGGDLGADTVDTSQIVDDAVTTAKVVNDAITAAKVLDAGFIANVKVGTFTGTYTAQVPDQEIALDFDPEFVYIIRVGATKKGVVKFTDVSGNTVYTVAGEPASSCECTLGTEKFTVGGLLNTNAAVFYYIALAAWE